MATIPTAHKRRVVVGVDGSEGSKHALRWAAWMASTIGSRLELLTAWGLSTHYGWTEVPNRWDPEADSRRLLNGVVNGVFGPHRPPDMELTVREGGAAGVLIDQAVGALLLVVGSRGHGGFTGLLLGSVSAHVAEHASCPVLVVHGDSVPPSLLSYQ
jgi:nucleotide-binding universal stress UspA family protein